MKIIHILFFATVVYSSTMVSQNEKFATAESFFEHGYYSSAVPVYLELLEADSSDIYLNFKTGLCYINSRSQRYKAIYHFQKAISSTSTYNIAYSGTLSSACINKLCGFNDFTTKENISHEILQHVSYRFLGEAYYFINEFDRAIDCYEKYKTIVLQKKNDKALIDNINKGIELCYFGKRLNHLNMSPLFLTITDGLYLRELTKKTKPSLSFANEVNNDIKALGYKGFETSPKRPIPVYTIQQVSQKNCFGKSIKNGETKGNETTVGTSTDGQLVLVYRVSPEGLGNLYTTRLIDNVWTKPEKLNKIVNTSGWETGEFISVDGSFMYFTSDKPGGYGGKDIYSSKKQPDGTWGKELNLGPVINTRYDEDAPFIYPNGTTLYFRSSGHMKSGCYDIFLSSLSDTGWTAPLNVGYPVDVSSDNSDYTGTSQNSAELGNTNYLATFFNLEKVPLTLVKRQIVNTKGRPLEDVKITITANDGTVSAVYNSNRGGGNYLFVLPDNTGTNIYYEAKGYFFQSEYIDFTKIKNMYESFEAVQLVPIANGSTIALNTIFFNDEETLLKPAAVFELDHLARFLIQNSTLSAQIVAYTNSSSGIRSGKKMAQERAAIVADYLISKGVGKERVFVKGYGKLKQKRLATKGTVELKQRYEINFK